MSAILAVLDEFLPAAVPFGGTGWNAERVTGEAGGHG